jgi:hypothetical protein
LEFLKVIKEMRDADREEMNAWRKEMRAIFGAHREEAMACKEMTEACLKCEEPTSVDNESEAEHREVSKKHAAEETDRAPSKRHRDRHLAAGRLGKPKELSRRKLAAACGKVSRLVRMAWHMRNILTNNWIRVMVRRGTRRVRALRRRLGTRHGGRRA